MNDSLPNCVPADIYQLDQVAEWQECETPCPVCGGVCYKTVSIDTVIAECDDCNFRQEVIC